MIQKILSQKQKSKRIFYHTWRTFWKIESFERIFPRFPIYNHSKSQKNLKKIHFNFSNLSKAFLLLDLWYMNCFNVSLMFKKIFEPFLNPKVELRQKSRYSPKGRCNWSRDADAANISPIVALGPLTHLSRALSVTIFFSFLKNINF